MSDEDLKKDSETQIEALLLALSEVFSECNGQLPMGLHVQQDNTCREGKKQFFSSAMILLVVLGVFRWTAMGFLRMGHSYPALCDHTLYYLSYVQGF